MTISVNFTWNVLKKHKKPLSRQIHWVVNIDKKMPIENLNSKNEFNGQSVTRVTINNQRITYDCKSLNFKNIMTYFITENIVKVVITYILATEI